MKRIRLRIRIPWATLRDYFFILFGSFLMGAGIGVFLVDARVVPGGVTGLSMAVHYLSGNRIPVGLLMWLLNVPLFVWGIKELGSRFGLRTFVGFTASSLFVDLLRGEVPGFRFLRLHQLPSIQHLQHQDFLFLILCGAVLLGAGLGLVFKFKGTTAGSDIVAAILNKRFGMKPGQAILFIDFFVITLAGAVIGLKHLDVHRPALTLTLYAFFLLFVSSKIIDWIIDGFDYARSALIISQRPQEIADLIMNRFSRGATALKGRGLYTNQEREVIYTVVSRKEIGELVELVKSTDPKAFVIVNYVHEVLGEGFRRRI